MVTRRTIKLIKSLQLKKYRKKHGLFLVEGNKLILELLSSEYRIQTLISTPVFIKTLEDSLETGNIPEIITTDEQTVSKAGHLQTNNAALAIVQIPEPTPFPANPPGYILALDGVKDPGNLGTILRIADWYGIRHVVCSLETTDIFNPKVISASMGSFLRVSTHYEALDTFLKNSSSTVYAADVGKGSSVHNTQFEQAGILLMGSESHGISPELEPYINFKINIPSFGGAESLNVSISTGIICDNILRSVRNSNYQ